jgi:hypothetical protein
VHPNAAVCPSRRSTCAATGGGRAHGLTPLRLHVARHACASYLRAAGVPLKVRSAILGHASTSSLSMTEDRYTHLMPGDLDAAKLALAAYLRASRNGSETTRRTPFRTPAAPNPRWNRALGPHSCGLKPPRGTEAGAGAQ